MRRLLTSMTTILVGFMLTFSSVSYAKQEDYAQAISTFQSAPEAKAFFNKAYGYAIFPSVGKGGIGIGGAHGKGRVYKGGSYTGDTKLSQLSIGLQFGGQVYSEVIFFQNAKAYNDFTSGNFEFSAQASAVAINAGANAQAGTTGNSAGAGQSSERSAANAKYVDGMAVFTAAKGGLMYEAALAGQKFSFKAK